MQNGFIIPLTDLQNLFAKVRGSAMRLSLLRPLTDL